MKKISFFFSSVRDMCLYFAACFLHDVSSIVDKPFLAQCIITKISISGTNLLCCDTQTAIIQLMSNWAAGNRNCHSEWTHLSHWQTSVLCHTTWRLLGSLSASVAEFDSMRAECFFSHCSLWGALPDCQVGDYTELCCVNTDSCRSVRVRCQ